MPGASPIVAFALGKREAIFRNASARIGSVDVYRLPQASNCLKFATISATESRFSSKMDFLDPESDFFVCFFYAFRSM